MEKGLTESIDQKTRPELGGWKCGQLLLERSHGLQPTMLFCPWDSRGNDTRVGCHFLLQCMKVKSESEVAKSCPTLSDPTWPGEQSRVLSPNGRGGWTPLRPLRGHQDIRVATREESVSIELVMPSSHLILCCPLLLLPPIPPSISVFQ